MCGNLLLLISKFESRNSNFVVWAFVFFSDNYTNTLCLQVCHKEGACHLILVKPVQDVADKADDSLIIVDRNKEKILEAITLCLEQPLCNMLQEWLRMYSEDSVILGEVKALYKTRLNQSNATDTHQVPDSLKTYLSRYLFSKI